MCVIGAGPSGIAAAKNLLGAGFRNVVVYDRNGEVGLAHTTLCLAHAYRRSGTTAAVCGTEVARR